MTAQINTAASFAAQTFAIENWVVYSMTVEPFKGNPETSVIVKAQCNFGVETIIANSVGEIAYGPSKSSAVDAWTGRKGNGVATFRSAPVKAYQAETMADAVVRQYR